MENIQKTTHSIEDTIEHFISFYKLDLRPYNKAYKIWFEKGLYSEIIIDFLKRINIPANVRLIKDKTSTTEFPNRVGYIILPTDANDKPIPFFSAEFKKIRFIIHIDISRYEKFELFITTLIHELAHLVLHSTQSVYRHSEVATDLFVMTFGLYEQFEYVLLRSKESEGYITRKQALFALTYIEVRKKFLNEKGLNKIWFKLKLWRLRRSFLFFIEHSSTGRASNY